TLVQTILEPAEDGIFRLEIYSNIGTRDAWTLHASATLGAARSVQAGVEPLAVADIQARCTELLSAAEHYDRLAQHGIALGPSLRCVRAIWRRDGEALGEIRLSDEQAADTH